MVRMLAALPVAISLSMSLPAHAGSYGNEVGVGYLTKGDKTKLYNDSTGAEVDAVVGKDFRLVAVSTARAFIGGVLATESESDGRYHVRYYKNGKDDSGGGTASWVHPADVTRFSFDCCGDARCSGIKAGVFQMATYTDCFVQAADARQEKITQPAQKQESQAADLERLRLQLEIEKTKLEMEKLKASHHN